MHTFYIEAREGRAHVGTGRHVETEPVSVDDIARMFAGEGKFKPARVYVDNGRLRIGRWVSNRPLTIDDVNRLHEPREEVKP